MTWLTYIALLNLTLNVSNYAHVDPRILVSAEKEVTRIYGDAGVTIVWVDGSSSDRLEDFDIKILARAGALGQDSNMLGSAPTLGRDSHWVYVFYDRIEALFARQVAAAIEVKTTRWARPEQILAVVMAHEVGHLLGLAHSPRGIMRAGWRSNDLLAASYGGLLFTPQQAELIRGQLRRLAIVN